MFILYTEPVNGIKRRAITWLNFLNSFTNCEHLKFEKSEPDFYQSLARIMSLRAARSGPCKVFSRSSHKNYRNQEKLDTIDAIAR